MLREGELLRRSGSWKPSEAKRRPSNSGRSREHSISRLDESHQAELHVGQAGLAFHAITASSTEAKKLVYA